MTWSVSGLPWAWMYFLNSSTPSSLTSRSTTNKLFLGPVGIPVLNRFGLISVFFWLAGSLHLQTGVLSLTLQGNFQKLSKGVVVALGWGLGSNSSNSSMVFFVLLPWAWLGPWPWHQGGPRFLE